MTTKKRVEPAPPTAGGRAKGACASPRRAGTAAPAAVSVAARKSGEQTAPPPSARTLPGGASVVDLERYVPAFLTWIANKLSRGASQHYLAVFDVGIEIWRCLVLLAIERSISAQNVSRIIGMDKASVSRCFKSMQARGLITMALDDEDGRVRMATLTRQGRELHDQIMGVALAREEALLSVLDAHERDTLVALLKRLHENLPAVEVATERHVARHFPARMRSRTRAPSTGRAARPSTRSDHDS